MKNKTSFLWATIAIIAFDTAAKAADSFSENFSNTNITTRLIAPAGYIFGTNATPVGTAQNAVFSDFREYITTAAADYNTVDFVMEITVSVRGPGPSQTAFVGFGSAIPDPNYFTEPHTSIYLRLFPDDFLDGALGLSISTDPSHHEEAVDSSSLHPGEGTHRVQLRKVANVLRLSCDVDYAGGPFVADYSVTRRMDTDLAFLNDSNSRLFFGVQGTNTTFDDLTVTVLPRLSIEVADVALCWRSSSNIMYQVEYQSELTTNMWASLGEPIVGNGTTNCILDSVRGTPRRFYRVIELP